ncbi:hypothetical protein G9A89_015992 [Geosiphon pyriformis]|nr:hypothetical protein G9A89_015992 [Geosiphon pyriformis]
MALHLINHPHLEQTLKYAGTTVGRDKVYRTIQYFSRFFAWHLYRQGYSKESIQRFTNLKNTLALSRKLMRLGKPLEHLQAASKSLREQDEFLKFASVGRQLGYAGYLFCDTFSWAHLAGVYKFNQIKRINQNAARFWFIGLVFSIIGGLYKLRQISMHEKISKHFETADNSLVKNEIKPLSRERKGVREQLIQDCLDLMIPSSSLGYLHLDDGLLGIVGLITSLMGVRNQWRKVHGVVN